MNIEELAQKMRDRAIQIEREIIRDFEAERREKEKELAIQKMQKLYFNAGRWAGGARDRTAKEAYERVTLGE